MMQRLPRLKKKIVPYALLFPTFLILGYILIYPALRNCFLSLWKWKLIQQAQNLAQSSAPCRRRSGLP